MGSRLKFLIFLKSLRSQSLNSFLIFLKETNLIELYYPGFYIAMAAVLVTIILRQTLLLIFVLHVTILKDFLCFFSASLVLSI